jgi:hypothetical protein
MVTLGMLLATKTLAAFAENGDLLANFPRSTPIEVAVASVAFENSGSVQDLQALVAAEIAAGMHDDDQDIARRVGLV